MPRRKSVRTQLRELFSKKLLSLISLTTDVDNLWHEQAGRDRGYEGDGMRRAYVRGMFAYMEGIVSMQKSVFLDCSAAAVPELSPAHLSLIREETYNIGDKGEIQIRPLFIPLPRNLLFTMSLYEQFGLGRVVIPAGNAGWATFLDALRFRHTLTHPRPADSLEVSDVMLAKCQKTQDWFNDIMLQASDLLHKHTRYARQS